MLLPFSYKLDLLQNGFRNLYWRLFRVEISADVLRPKNVLFGFEFFMRSVDVFAVERRITRCNDHIRNSFNSDFGNVSKLVSVHKQEVL